MEPFYAYFSTREMKGASKLLHIIKLLHYYELFCHTYLVQVHFCVTAYQGRHGEIRGCRKQKKNR